MEYEKPDACELFTSYKRELSKNGRLSENDVLLLRWLKNPRYNNHDDLLLDYPAIPGWEPYGRIFSDGYRLWDALVWWSGEVKPGEEYELTPDLPEETNNTDIGNAARLVYWYGSNLLFCHPRRQWLVWDGKRWRPDDTAAVTRMAKATVRGIYAEASSHSNKKERKDTARWAMQSESREHVNAMIELARSEVPVLPEQLDADPWLLAVNNGVLDLKTGALLAHDPDLYLTRLAPVDLDPRATCPLWLKFLGEIMDNDETTISFLQRAIGYSLTGDTSERAFFVLYGTGANGKSTFLETIRSAMGDYAQRIPTETLLASKRQAGTATPDIARLKGARFVSASETEQGRRLAEAVIKDLTGNDTITARFLYGHGFDFMPECKIWLGTNHKPEIRGTDPAIWDRVRLIPFKVRIPEDKQDKHLTDKLKAELPGILAWAVRGCLDWQVQGLGVVEKVKAATAAYRNEMDILGAFIEDCCIEGNEIEGNEYEALAGDLLEAYKEWSGDKNMNHTRFGRALRERGYEREKRGGHVYWHGLGLLAGQLDS